MDAAVSAQLESSNAAVKNAYSKVTSLKADLMKETGRLENLKPVLARDQRLVKAGADDLQEVIDNSADFVSQLLLMIGSKQSMEHVENNVKDLYTVAEFIKDAKDVQDRCKKMK